MRKLCAILSTLVFAVPLYGQKVETRDPNPNQIIQVRTALNHLTVIQLAQPVLSVAAGSDAFKVEWRANKVFIEPTEAGVSTNLFIWTKSGRENYELEPAGSVAAMDFAIDAATNDPEPAPKPEPRASIDPTKALMDGMLGGTPVRQESWKARKHRVQVMVRDLFEQNGELFIRYSIDNSTKEPYVPGTPHVVLLTEVSGALALRAYTQLSDREAPRLTTGSGTPVHVMTYAAHADTILPGHEAVGVVGLKLPVSRPAVVRLEFRDDQGRRVSAVVVL